MRVLALGDIITPSAVEFLAARLWAYRKAEKIDLVIVNAENASFLSGVTKPLADTLFQGGSDILTGGNHSLQSRSVHALHEDNPPVLRPINYPCGAPGRGYTLTEAAGYRVLVMNAMGTALIEPVLDHPVPYIERALEREAGNYDLAILDFHAEATGEKVALARRFDGRFAAIFGTHTHVPMADLQILPRGTGYVTDLGATAPTGGVLGVKTEVIQSRLETCLPASYQPAEGPIRAEGVLFDIDPATARCLSLKRVTLEE